MGTTWKIDIMQVDHGLMLGDFNEIGNAFEKQVGRIQEPWRFLDL